MPAKTAQSVPHEGAGHIAQRDLGVGDQDFTAESPPSSDADNLDSDEDDDEGLSDYDDQRVEDEDWELAERGASFLPRPVLEPTRLQTSLSNTIASVSMSLCALAVPRASYRLRPPRSQLHHSRL
jgi:hypothetical protein